MVERLHRRLLDVIKDEFDRRGRSDVNSVQALLLYNIGDKELTAGELRTRGYYLGSNVSYNVKKLVEMGYLHHQRSRIDRRSVRISLTDEGREVHEIVEVALRQARAHSRADRRHHARRFQEREYGAGPPRAVLDRPYPLSPLGRKAQFHPGRAANRPHRCDTKTGVSPNLGLISSALHLTRGAPGYSLNDRCKAVIVPSCGVWHCDGLGQSKN